MYTRNLDNQLVTENSGTKKGLTRMKKRERKLPTIKIQKLQNLKGGWEVRQRSTPTKKMENSHKSCDLDPYTLAPRLPDVCEKNLFPFFCSLVSGKQDVILLGRKRQRGGVF